MNIRVVLLFVMNVLCLSGMAQEYFKPELMVGARGGMGYSLFRFSPRSRQITQEPLQATAYGLSLVYYTSYYWGIKWGMNVEFNQVTKGWRDVWPEGAGVEYERYMTYWDIPIFTQANFGTKGWRYIVNLGPFLNFMSGGKETLESETQDKFPFYYGAKVDNKFQFGIGGGVGVAKTLPFGRVQVEGRAMQSLMGIFRFDSEDSYTSQHRYFEVSAGLYVTILKSNRRKKQKEKVEEERKEELSKDLPIMEKEKEEKKEGKKKGKKKKEKKDEEKEKKDEEKEKVKDSKAPKAEEEKKKKAE